MIARLITTSPGSVALYSTRMVARSAQFGGGEEDTVEAYTGRLGPTQGPEREPPGGVYWLLDREHLATIRSSAFAGRAHASGGLPGSAPRPGLSYYPAPFLTDTRA